MLTHILPHILSLNNRYRALYRVFRGCGYLTVLLFVTMSQGTWMNEYILTVMARDRIGIVRDVSSALSSLGGNITHLSQTVLRGYFTLIISVQVPDQRTDADIREAVEARGSAGELQVSVAPFQVSPPMAGAATERFTLSMQGKDQPGIIARTTSYLAERGINVDDFYSYVHDGILLMLAQVSIPTGMDIERVQADLREVGREFALVVHLQHEDIFRATSDVGPVGQQR
jgi:glycine cleavage system transcriptional repressor